MLRKAITLLDEYVMSDGMTIKLYVYEIPSFFLAISGLLIWSCVEKDHIQLPNSIIQVELEDIRVVLHLVCL